MAVLESLFISNSFRMKSKRQIANNTDEPDGKNCGGIPLKIVLDRKALGPLVIRRR